MKRKTIFYDLGVAKDFSNQEKSTNPVGKN